MAQNYRIEGKLDGQSRAYRFLALGEPELPLRYSVLVSEVVHHLRSTLDHLITQLAHVGPGSGDPQVLEFPICLTEQKFKAAVQRGKIQGVSKNAALVIESLQPYKDNPPEHSTLWLLHDLSRVDKHRLLLVVAACVQMADILKINSNADTEIAGMSPPIPLGTRPCKEGTEVFTVEFGSKFDPAIQIDGNFAFRAEFAEPFVLTGRPITDLLAIIRDRVTEVIHQLLAS